LATAVADSRVKRVISLDPWFGPAYQKLVAKQFKVDRKDTKILIIMTETFNDWISPLTRDKTSKSGFSNNDSLKLFDELSPSVENILVLKENHHLNQTDILSTMTLEMYLAEYK